MCPKADMTVSCGSTLILLHENMKRIVADALNDDSICAPFKANWLSKDA